MPKNIIPINAQKKLLQDCVFNSTSCKQMRVIIDLDNVEYYKLRAIELITHGKLADAQMLLNIARYKQNEGTKRKNK